MCDLVYSYRNLEAMRESMPQTVPSAGFSPQCDYSHFAADWFDLSLLPSPDGEVPYSPINLQQVMSFYSDPITSPPSMFPSSAAQDDFKNTAHRQNESSFQFSLPQPNTIIKEEPLPFRESSSCSFMSPTSYTALSTSPMPSPAGSSSSYQKCPSPAYSVKHEQAVDLQDFLKDNQILKECIEKQDNSNSNAQEQSSFSNTTQSDISARQLNKPQESGAGDHRLLREVLRDTSFQRKFNIKPIDFGALASGFGISENVATTSAEVKLEEGEALWSREKMEPVLSMAIEQLRKDIGDTCGVLGIAADPSRWTVDDVKKWLLWTLRQYDLPMINMEYFEVDGAVLTGLTEQEFQDRAAQCGSTLYAQLEIWKAACQELDVGGLLWNNGNNSSSSSGDASEDDDDDCESSQSIGGGKAATSRSGSGGSHIHLWQFLKELLASPQLHGSCIRWLDRPKGIFKIEDSVRVARLWGKRKNRPAMNYDKLSRSIRQYYKKGIMKKTERSQRLVYQFCHPYSL